MKRFSLAVILSALFLAASAQPKVVGHRGCRHNTPDAPETPYYENTISALKFAQSLGIYAAEFDIQLTSDEKIIVFHGKEVPGIKKNIQKITFDEARKVVLPGGHQMPTLEEWFIQARKHPETKIICEIKKQATKERETKAVEQVMALTKKMGMESQMEYTTFSEWMCQEIHRIDPSAKVIFLSSGVFVEDPDYCKKMGYNGISYNLDGFLNHPDYVTRARELGLETTLWLVNDYEVIDWAILHKIDYISSDHPEKLKAYMDGIGKFGNR